MPVPFDRTAKGAADSWIRASALAWTTVGAAELATGSSPAAIRSAVHDLKGQGVVETRRVEGRLEFRLLSPPEPQQFSVPEQPIPESWRGVVSELEGQVAQLREREHGLTMEWARERGQQAYIIGILVRYILQHEAETAETPTEVLQAQALLAHLNISSEAMQAAMAEAAWLVPLLRRRQPNPLPTER